MVLSFEVLCAIDRINNKSDYNESMPSDMITEFVSSLQISNDGDKTSPFQNVSIGFCLQILQFFNDNSDKIKWYIYRKTDTEYFIVQEKPESVTCCKFDEIEYDHYCDMIKGLNKISYC